MPRSDAIQREFFRRLDPGPQLAALFEFLPEVFFYVKDRDGRIVTANKALAVMRGFKHEQEMVGRTDFDLHPRHLAERYVAEDRRVIATGKPLPDQVWLVPDETGGLRWYLSSKVPLFGRPGRDGEPGRVEGVAGMLRDLRKFETAYRPYRAMDAVLKHVLDHYSERIDVPDLAALAGLSTSQFDRRFKALFGLTPREYLLRVRTDAAAHALVTTTRTAAAIAADCGFYDQSSFGKQFRKRLGMTPAEYRRRYAARP